MKPKSNNSDRSPESLDSTKKESTTSSTKETAPPAKELTPRERIFKALLEGKRNRLIVSHQIN